MAKREKIIKILNQLRENAEELESILIKVYPVQEEIITTNTNTIRNVIEGFQYTFDLFS
jgi:hypothetical protein